MITALFDWTANQILALDPEVQSELAALAGKLIEVEWVGTDLSLYLQLTLTGLQSTTARTREPDAVISGTPIALAAMSLSQKWNFIPKPDGVEIRGDAELVHQFTRIMKKFRIDWEELIAKALGDRVAQQVGSKVRAATDYGADVTERLQAHAVLYIQEELRLLPPQEEVADFMCDVDELNNRVERLMALAKR